MRISCMLLCAAIATSAALPVAAQSRPTPPNSPKAGNWEIVSRIEASSGPSKVVTSRLCYSAADVASPARTLPPQRGMGLACEASDVRRETSLVRWTLTCNGKSGAFTGKGELTPGASSYTAKVSLQSAVGKARFDQTITGNWVSECR